MSLKQTQSSLAEKYSKCSLTEHELIMSVAIDCPRTNLVTNLLLELIMDFKIDIKNAETNC